MSGQRYLFEEWVLDCGRGALVGAHCEVALRPKNVDVLRYLIENAGCVVSRDDLFSALWPDVTVSEESLTQCVSEIRHALADSEQRIIKTVPKRGYSFLVPVTREPASELHAFASSMTPAGYGANIAAEIPQDGPIICVLPFANLSGDIGQEYLSDGFTEDLINGLSHFTNLLVIARNTSFSYKGRSIDVRDVGRQLGVRYVVTGSVRRLGDVIRITAQLVDAASGVQWWSERFDREFGDDIAVLDEAAQTIVRLAVGHVGKAEEERASEKASGSRTAYDLALQGHQAMRAYLRSWTVDHLYEARRLFQEVLKLEPGNANVCAELAHTFLRAYHEPLDQDYTDEKVLRHGYELALKAVSLDPHLPIARAHLGWALFWMRQLDASIEEFERAVSLNPNFSDFRFAAVLIYAGAVARALEMIRANLGLDPLLLPNMYALEGHALHMLGRYSDAVAPLRESIRRTPRILLGHLWLAATLVRLGQRAEARAVAAEVIRLSPVFTLKNWPAFALYRDWKDHEKMTEALRAAGLS
jgi:TolB-like protein